MGSLPHARGLLHLQYLSRTSGDPGNIYYTDPQFMADRADHAPVGKKVEAFVQIETMLDQTYIGTNDGSAAPLYGNHSPQSPACG